MNDDVNKSLEFEEKTLVELVGEVEEKTLVENSQTLVDSENCGSSVLGSHGKADESEIKVTQNVEVIKTMNKIVSKPEVKWDFPQRDFNDFFKNLGYEIESERTDIATEKIRYFVLKRNNERYFAKVSLNIPDLKTVKEIHEVINEYPDNFVRVFEEGISDDFYYEIREYCPENFLLVPGIGHQGGDFDKIVNSGINKDCGLIMSSSRQIIYASNGKDFAEKARIEAISWNEKMKSTLKMK